MLKLMAILATIKAAFASSKTEDQLLIKVLVTVAVLVVLVFALAWVVNSRKARRQRTGAQQGDAG